MAERVYLENTVKSVRRTGAGCTESGSVFLPGCVTLGPYRFMPSQEGARTRGGYVGRRR